MARPLLVLSPFVEPAMSSIPEALARAWQHHRAGDLPRAESIYRQILQAEPANAQVWYLLGAACQVRGELSEAEASYRQALSHNPDFAEVHHNLGVVLATQRKLEEAVASFRQALRLDPRYPEALNGLGTALRIQGKWAESETYLRHALRLKADFAEAHYNLGNTLYDQGKLEEAVTHLQQAIHLKPTDPKAHNNLGGVYRDQGKIEEAVAAYQRTLALRPDHARAHSNLLYALHYYPAYGPQTVFAEHLHWAKRHAGPLAAEIRPHPVEPVPDRRLRIGYVSPDFRSHVVASFIEPILSAHDRAGFEVTCYADVASPDSVTQRLRGYVNRWRSLVGIADEQAAELIRDDQIDILVDLAGHTGGNRLLVFARKPAPIQVSHFGYPDTTGLPTMDYRITDARADPPGMTERFYTEKLFRLPEVAWCYRPPEGPAVSDLPAFQKGHLTFGCFNNPAKVTVEAVTLWAKILTAVPGARLSLLACQGKESHERLYREWSRNGIEPERVTLVAKKPHEAYLKLCESVDLGLDPFPYNGAVTTCDMVWMGVPVITLAGMVYVSRQGVSLLTHLGLPELIAETPDAYVEIATQLAHDWAKLRDIRMGLRGIMRRSTLTDAKCFTRQLEDAYRRMWSKWCQFSLRSGN